MHCWAVGPFCFLGTDATCWGKRGDFCKIRRRAGVALLIVHVVVWAEELQLLPLEFHIASTSITLDLLLRIFECGLFRADMFSGFLHFRRRLRRRSGRFWLANCRSQHCVLLVQLGVCLVVLEAARLRSSPGALRRHLRRRALRQDCLKRISS